MRSRVLDRLVKRGIVERDNGGLLSLARGVARSRRYPMVDGEAGQEVELRIMTALFTDETPSPRDIMLISLVHACGIFDRLLSPGELAEVRDRIDRLCKLELIGRSISEAIHKAGIPDTASAYVRGSAALAPPPPPFADGALPIVGNALSMTGNLSEWLAKRFRELGPVFRIRALSHVFTVLAGPEANRFLLQQGRLHLRNVKFYARMTQALGAHRFINGMDGAEHFRLRKVLGNGYSRAYVLDRIDDAIGIIVREVDALPVQTPMAALPTLQRLIGKQIGVLCTGVHADEYMDDLIRYLDRMITVTSMRSPGFMMRTPRMRRIWARMEALCEQVLKTHEPERRKGKVPDLIDDILALHRADPQFLPETELTSACLGPFFVSLHTEASIAASMLYSLLKYPDIMTRVLQEVDEFFAGGGPTAGKLRAMDVTHRVGMETLRLYGPAPSVMRTVVNAFEFEGYAIPAGTTAMFATTVPHFLPEYFSEPERFDIERYAPGRAEHRQPGAYAPFGLGTHRCLGDGFMEVSLALTLATMLHRAKITMHPPNYKLKMGYSPVAAPKSSFKIMVTPRH